MSEAGHHDRANRWDDAAAGGQGHWATRQQREEVIAVHLAACRNGMPHASYRIAIINRGRGIRRL
jgi:hypothetical protein